VEESLTANPDIGDIASSEEEKGWLHKALKQRKASDCLYKRFHDHVLSRISGRDSSPKEPPLTLTPLLVPSPFPFRQFYLLLFRLPCA
jgi:hypothetical protein